MACSAAKDCLRKLGWVLAASAHTRVTRSRQNTRYKVRLWDRGGRGRLHVQSQRFLSDSWPGLHGHLDAPDGDDPPLRHLVERVAAGVSLLQIHESDGDSKAGASFFKWVAAMKHAPCRE